MKNETKTQTKDLLNTLLLDMKGDVITVSASNALPPGTRVSFTPTVENEQSPISLNGKVVSLKQQENSYQLVIRLHSLSRPDRECLELLIKKVQ